MIITSKKASINVISKLFIIMCSAFTAGVLLFCEEPFLPEKMIYINLSIDTSTVKNQPANTFFVKDSAVFLIDVVFTEPIAALALKSIPLNTEQSVSLETIRAIPNTMYSVPSIALNNRITYKFDEPGEFLFVGLAFSKDTSKIPDDYDTVRIRVMEKTDYNQAPEISLRVPVNRRYASPELPCSLMVNIKNEEPWQKKTMTVLNSDGPIELTDDSLLVWIPSPDDTPGYRELAIVVTDNGLPPKSDTLHMNFAILDRNGKLPPPENVRVTKPDTRTYVVQWDTDFIPDEYLVSRSINPDSDTEADTFTVKNAWYVDSSDTKCFYRVRSKSVIKNKTIFSDASEVICVKDTLHYAHKVSLSAPAKTITKDIKSCSCTLLVSKAAKAPISVRLLVYDNDKVTDSAKVTIKQGDSTTAIQLKHSVDSITAGNSKTLTVSIASVSSGYAAGIVKQSIVIINNDSTRYNLIYHANLGSGTIPKDSTKYKPGTQVKVRENYGLTRTGYTFKGWNERTDGKGTHYEPDSYFSLQNKSDTLYAQWERLSFTIKFNSQGGGVVAPEDVYYIDTIPVPITPSLPAGTKCTFKGWYNEAVCVTLWNFSTRITSAVTLYAKWNLDVMPETNCIIANSSGPHEAISAYNLVDNRRVGFSKDSTVFKDLQDLSLAGEVFSGKLGSQNGTTFALATQDNFDNVTNVSLKNLIDIKNMLNTIAVENGTVFVARLGNNRGYAIVQINEFDPYGTNWTENRGVAKFTYKFSPR